jgi:hypothetical protein
VNCDCKQPEVECSSAVNDMFYAKSGCNLKDLNCQSRIVVVQISLRRNIVRAPFRNRGLRRNGWSAIARWDGTVPCKTFVFPVRTAAGG